MKTILLLSTVAMTSLCVAAQAQIPLDMPRPRTPDQVKQAPAPLAPRPPASEPSESIDVRGVTLRLGMAQDEVIQRFSKDYDVQDLGAATSDDSSWLIAAKNGAGLAEIIFSKGRLSSVRKFWTGAGESDTELGFASALYRAITSFEQEGKTPCKITTNSSQRPDSEIKTVSITCGGQKHLDVDVSQAADGQDSTGVTEILGNYLGSQPELVAAPAVRGGAAVAEPEKEQGIAQTPDEILKTIRETPTPEEVEAAVNAAEKVPHVQEAGVSANARREVAELSNPSSLVTLQTGERLPDEEFVRITIHNRALCDQVITVAGLTPRGLALYVPPEGQKFMAKNSQNYPRMCLLEDSNIVVPGVPRYLLVYAYSESAFARFQPVTQTSTTTTPVSGWGTLLNSYGDAWNFTYYGTVETTEMDTIETPYVIQSHSLYLNAYDVSGAVVSRHSITVSSQIGGNGASAIGYNGAQLIALLWNNPSRLIKSVLKDVQKDSQKYPRK